jgi:SAM-dependent methyltransferase
MNSKKMYETYDKIAKWYDEARSRDLRFELQHLEKLSRSLAKGSKILDLGCGTGRPIADFLSQQRFQVTGVDGSHEMIALAKKYVPAAKFYVQDMRELDLSEKFDAILMWHSSFHLSVADQIPLFKKLQAHLNPGGYLMFTSGTTNGEVWSENGGEQIYHASLSLDEYRDLLKTHHFEVISLNIEDKASGGATVWFARYRG